MASLASLFGGSSPLTRGKPIHGDSLHLVTVAHPRSRGENQAAADARTDDTGSSPLTRGKRRCLHCFSMFVGLIPAHAGKTPA